MIFGLWEREVIMKIGKVPLCSFAPESKTGGPMLVS